MVKCIQPSGDQIKKITIQFTKNNFQGNKKIIIFNEANKKTEAVSKETSIIRKMLKALNPKIAKNSDTVI